MNQPVIDPAHESSTCPFCGVLPEFERTSNFEYALSCNNIDCPVNPQTRFMDSMEKANILWMTRVPIKTDQTADETSKERAMTQPTIEQMIEFLSMRITAGMMTAGYYRGDAMAVEFVDMNMAIRAALAEKQGGADR